MRKLFSIILFLSMIFVVTLCSKKKETEVVYVTATSDTNQQQNTTTQNYYATTTTALTTQTTTTDNILDQTTYQLLNNSSITLFNVSSYYYNGSDYHDIVNHGDLYENDITNKVITNYSTIDIVLYLHGGNRCLVISPVFYITKNQNNIYYVSDNTDVYCGKNEDNKFEGTIKELTMSFK